MMPTYTAGLSVSTVLPDMDFETYSDAGYTFDGTKFVGATKNKRGLELVGAAAYAEHPSTEVLSLAYDLKDGLGARLWLPDMGPPADLTAHIRAGGLIEAHDSGFEYYIWFYVCYRRMGWGPLPLEQLRCSMAKARAYGLPGALAVAARVVGAAEQKDEDGSRIMRRLSVPRRPTKTNPALRWTPETDPGGFRALYAYNVQDEKTEAALSAKVPDLQPQELKLWLLDQRINVRGVAVDTHTVEDCVAVLQQARDRYNLELQQITEGAVHKASEAAKIITWLGSKGVFTPNLDEVAVKDLLARTDLSPQCRRVVEIRGSLGSSSVFKLFSIRHRVNSDGRLRGLFAYCGADRTGRFSGRGPQPQNLPNSGPKVKRCDPVNGCGSRYAASLERCPECAAPEYFAQEEGWSPEAAKEALSAIAHRDLDYVEARWGDAVAAISGCLRGLFVAQPGHDLICSDYSAIEGVVASMLSGEQWRIDVFRGHGKIYEMGASKITGIPFAEMMDYKERTGNHHPSRKMGKVSELASFYGGWIGAWLNFGAGEFLSEPEIKAAVLAWRAASPAVVEMWGGQHRKHPDRWEFSPELYGLEGAAVQALLNPGQCFGYRGVIYGYNPRDAVLYCQLPSGRFLHYHRARLSPHVAKNGMPEYQILYEGRDDQPGGRWVTLATYGGKLFENICQAVARDIMAHGMINLDRAGYPIVLHVHDEVVAEVPRGWGSVEEFEAIMGRMPAWAEDWPIKAAGGWRGERYRKD